MAPKFEYYKERIRNVYRLSWEKDKLSDIAMARELPYSKIYRFSAKVHSAITDDLHNYLQGLPSWYETEPRDDTNDWVQQVSLEIYKKTGAKHRSIRISNKLVVKLAHYKRYMFY